MSKQDVLRVALFEGFNAVDKVVTSTEDDATGEVMVHVGGYDEPFKISKEGKVTFPSDMHPDLAYVIGLDLASAVCLWEEGIG